MRDPRRRRSATLDTIAAEIGISKRTLYNPSKDELIAAHAASGLVRLLGLGGALIAATPV